MPSFCQLWKDLAAPSRLSPPQSPSNAHVCTSNLHSFSSFFLYPPAVRLPIRYSGYLHIPPTYPLCSQSSHHQSHLNSPEVALLFPPEHNSFPPGYVPALPSVVASMRNVH